MATISIRLNQQEEELFKGYAELTGENLSTLFKEALKKALMMNTIFRYTKKHIKSISKIQ